MAIQGIIGIAAVLVILTAGIDLSIPSAIILGEVFTVKALQMIPVGEKMAVAIPAVIAYNHYAAKLGLFTGELEGFASEFIGTLAREGRV